MESQYYAQTPQQVLHAVESQEEGLTTQQAQERIEKLVQTPCGRREKSRCGRCFGAVQRPAGGHPSLWLR